jgi:hypothetical protein
MSMPFREQRHHRTAQQVLPRGRTVVLSDGRVGVVAIPPADDHPESLAVRTADAGTAWVCLGQIAEIKGAPLDP